MARGSVPAKKTPMSGWKRGWNGNSDSYEGGAWGGKDACKEKEKEKECSTELGPPKYSIHLPSNMSPQRTVVLSHNPMWSQEEVFTWTENIPGIPAPTGQALSNFEEKFVDVANTLTEFRDSDSDCLADFLANKNATPFALPSPCEAASCGQILATTQFFGHNVTLSLQARNFSPSHTASIHFLERVVDLESLLEMEPIHVGFLCCEGGMVYIIEAFYRILQLMKKIPKCFHHPLYSCRHYLVKDVRKRWNFCRCTECYLTGELGFIEFSAQSLPHHLWKGSPALQPPEDGSSPLLQNLLKLEHLFWRFLPFQVGKLMCTNKEMFDFFTNSSTQWKSFILSSRPYLLHYYDEMVASWRLSLPKLITRIRTIVPLDVTKVTPTTSSQPVIGYLQRTDIDNFFFVTADRYKSLPFLQKERALQFFEVSCYNWCKICLLEIKDESMCSKHTGQWRVEGDEYGVDTWWDCCGVEGSNFLYCPKKKNPIPHVPVPEIEEVLRPNGGDAK